jgi:hypothetical protein
MVLKKRPSQGVVVSGAANSAVSGDGTLLIDSQVPTPVLLHGLYAYTMYVFLKHVAKKSKQISKEKVKRSSRRLKYTLVHNCTTLTP